MNDLPNSAEALYAAWQRLRSEQSRLHARDAAVQLGVSEAELVASRMGIDTIRLQADWAGLLRVLGELGEVMVLTRNESCVHERKGVYRELSLSANGQMGLVVSPHVDLRMFLSGWRSAFAVEEESARGVQRSVQFFDAQGVAVHKVFLTENSDLAAWGELLERFHGAPQDSSLDLQPRAQAVVELDDGQIDVEGLRFDWAQLKDPHHFFAFLKKHGTSRLQALRLGGREWAEPLATGALTKLFETAARQELPFMVFVGNRHCVQIHTGTVSNLRWMDNWFNVLDPLFNLHLKADDVQQLWRVRKPSADGVITSWEAFDAQGELIVQLFGARRPGMPECEHWRRLAETQPALPA
jgi:putative hemin transport protein